MDDLHSSRGSFQKEEPDFDNVFADLSSSLNFENLDLSVIEAARINLLGKLSCDISHETRALKDLVPYGAISVCSQSCRIPLGRRRSRGGAS